MVSIKNAQRYTFFSGYRLCLPENILFFNGNECHSITRYTSVLKTHAQQHLFLHPELTGEKTVLLMFQKKELFTFYFFTEKANPTPTDNRNPDQSTPKLYSFPA